MSGLFGSTTIKGTRITDFAQTSADVGSTIPFLYGRAPVKGNVIFAALPPKETRSVQRQGKGGVKQEVYTYSTSYAIAFCRGPILGYWWIKRNGKVVYSQDPNAPIEDKAYAAKWAAKVMMYNGTMGQLPNSTIESYKGSGRVSAFRGLSYVVLPNEDVTEGGGAIPSYEAVPIAAPAEVWITSKPYDQFWEDTAYIAATPQFVLRDLMVAADAAPDHIQQGVTPVGGSLISLYKDVLVENDHIQQGVTPVGGSLTSLYKDVLVENDHIQQGVTPVGGRLVDIPIGKQQSDSLSAVVRPVSGNLLDSGSWVTTLDSPLSGVNGAWAGYNCRVRIPASVLPAGTKLRLHLRGASGEGLKIADLRIGRAAATGNCNFAAAPVRIQFGGVYTKTIAADQLVVTDDITITVTGTDDYILAMYPVNDAANDAVSYAADGNGWSTWYKQASNQAATLTVTGYLDAAGGNVQHRSMIEKIQVF